MPTPSYFHPSRLSSSMAASALTLLASLIPWLQAQNPLASSGQDVVWVDDDIPGQAKAYTTPAGSWNWTSQPKPFSGRVAMQSPSGGNELRQHFFADSQTPMRVNDGDTLFAYVYLDPKNPPQEIMLQWQTSNWNHRAYWGQNRIDLGKDATESRRHQGPLPPTGRWIRLEVPSSSIGLYDQYVTGMAFSQFGGNAAWDYAGVRTTPPSVLSSSAPNIPATSLTQLPPVTIPDSDYDGRNDQQERADGTNPNDPRDVLPFLLSSWNFDNTLVNDRQAPPFESQNIGFGPGQMGSAIEIAKPGARLRYREVESDGQANFNCQSGSIRFWFKPNWSPDSGGPKTSARLFEMGVYTGQGKIGSWSLYFSQDGKKLHFTGESDRPIQGRGVETFLEANIKWSKPEWHEIVLSYGPQTNDFNSTLYIDGVVMAHGKGVTRIPPASIRQSMGFSLGSDYQGNYQANGWFDEFQTYNYRIGKGEIMKNQIALCATPNLSDSSITLEWLPQTNPKLAKGTEIKRRLIPETQFESLARNYTDTRFVDRNVQAGKRYEYVVNNRYITAALHLPPVEIRGKAILLIDETLARDLEDEVQGLRQDLVGDGWIVRDFLVPRHNDSQWTPNVPNIRSIKNIITTEYKRDPELFTTLYLIGHVAIPYSGEYAEDGHPDHRGAWPTDGYYADIDDDKWTDKVNWNKDKPEPLLNREGDGKFDHNRFPSFLEMGLGRIDFSRMPTFGSAYGGFFGSDKKAEINMLKNYFRKASLYRHGKLPFQNRSVVAGYLATSDDPRMYETAIQNSCAWFGLSPTAVTEGNPFALPQPAAWGFLTGYGSGSSITYSYASVNGRSVPLLHTTKDLAQPKNHVQFAFGIFVGSYFGDWNFPDNFMRAMLASENYGLATMWGRYYRWRFETLALGDTLAQGFLLTANDRLQSSNGAPRWLNILGDPTLRMPVLAPPQNARIQTSGSQLELSWNPSPANPQGYFVYRSDTGPTGPYTRITPTPLNTTTFSLNRSTATSNTWFQIKAVHLTQTASGAFDNLSQALFLQAP